MPSHLSGPVLQQQRRTKQLGLNVGALEAPHSDQLSFHVVSVCLLHRAHLRSLLFCRDIMRAAPATNLADQAEFHQSGEVVFARSQRPV